MKKMKQVDYRILSTLAEANRFIFEVNDGTGGAVFSKGSAKPVMRVNGMWVTGLLAARWIEVDRREKRSIRYVISDEGRRALHRAGHRLTEAKRPSRKDHRIEAEKHFRCPATKRMVKAKVNLGESPLGWLARRKKADGSPFLSGDEIAAGERLRADFEAAQMGPNVTQDWRRFIAPIDGGRSCSAQERAVGSSAEDARRRLFDALDYLGPDLSDAAFRTCCFLHGLECVESEMGWSARSGKVVLRIALRRLAKFYAASTRQTAPITGGEMALAG